VHHNLLQVLGVEHTEEVHLPAGQPDQASQRGLPSAGAGTNGAAERPAKRARTDGSERSSALEQPGPQQHAHEAHGGKNGALHQPRQRRLQRVLHLHGLRSLQLLDALPGVCCSGHAGCMLKPTVYPCSCHGDTECGHLAAMNVDLTAKRLCSSGCLICAGVPKRAGAAAGSAQLWADESVAGQQQGRFRAALGSAYFGALPGSCAGCQTWLDASEAPRHMARTADGMALEYSSAAGEFWRILNS
jgi:hypothetical protein